MKKIFIDLGANNGCSVDLFLKSFSDSREYEIHSFECNPYMIEIYKKRFPDYKLYNSAVSTTYGETKFYIGDTILSSSLREDKTTGMTRPTEIKVKCIDISDFIIKNFSRDDIIILKMDIEGSEYDILPKMLEDGLFDGYINTLYGEWHWNKLKNISKQFHDNLIQQLKQKNFIMKEWCAETQTIGV